MSRVLVVEDENIVALDIKKSLLDMGYDVQATVSTGEECVGFASEYCPDLVLMDIRIKGNLDGISTAEILKDKFDIPVVFLTAHADDETIERAKKSNPYGYLLKPFKPAELKSVVEIALSKHQNERNIRMREKWMATSLQAVGNAVIAVDKSGDITFMNTVAEKITGYSLSQVMGKKLIDVMPLINEKTRELVQTPIIRVLKEKKIFSLPQHTSLVGQQIESSIENSAAITDEAGDLIGAVIVFRNEAEHGNQFQQVVMADRLTSLGSLVFGVAHEINNPLSVIVANATFVADGLKKFRKNGDSHFYEMIDAIQDVQDASDRVRKIVMDLKMFSQPQNEVIQPIHVHDVLNWSLRITTNQVRHCAKFVKNFNEIPLVDGSELRLGQVFVNLIINAAQAIEVCSTQGNEIRIFTFTDLEGRVVIQIQDTGCGIGPDTMKRIFDPFYTTKPAGVGTGLGLSISRGIIHSLGGTITVESKVGQGSTFQITLPQAKGHFASAPTQAGFSTKAHRSKVLVVDDEPLLLKLIQRTLGEDHDVVITDSSVEAFNQLKSQHDFDIVLCDLMMPEMTGMELYERVTDLSPGMSDRFAFMTGGAFTPSAMEFVINMPVKHLDKPFTPVILKNFVNEFLTINHPDQ